jgi:hypothetical protein
LGRLGAARLQPAGILNGFLKAPTAGGWSAPAVRPKESPAQAAGIPPQQQTDDDGGQDTSSAGG